MLRVHHFTVGLAIVEVDHPGGHGGRVGVTCRIVRDEATIATDRKHKDSLRLAAQSKSS